MTRHRKGQIAIIVETTILLAVVSLILCACIKSPLSICGTPNSCTFNTTATTTVQAPKIDGL